VFLHFFLLFFFFKKKKPIKKTYKKKPIKKKEGLAVQQAYKLHQVRNLDVFYLLVKSKLINIIQLLNLQ
jgi:hypothetical protein